MYLSAQSYLAAQRALSIQNCLNKALKIKVQGGMKRIFTLRRFWGDFDQFCMSFSDFVGAFSRHLYLF